MSTKTTITTLIRLLTRPYHTDGKQVTQNRYYWCPSTQILVWDNNLEGKATVDDPMEAVKATFLRWRLQELHPILAAAHSGALVTMKNSRMRKMKVTNVSKALDVAQDRAFSCGFPKWRWASLCRTPDDNGLINVVQVMKLVNSRSSRHHGCQLTYTDGESC